MVCKNWEGTPTLNIRAVRCVKDTDNTPVLLGKGDHLLQHLAGLEYSLTEGMTYSTVPLRPTLIYRRDNRNLKTSEKVIKDECTNTSEDPNTNGKTGIDLTNNLNIVSSGDMLKTKITSSSDIQNQIFKNMGLQPEKPKKLIYKYVIEIWRDIVLKHNPTVKFIPEFTLKEKGQLNATMRKFGDKDGLDILKTVLRDWVAFTAFVEANTEAFKTPLVPVVGFLLKHAAQAMNFYALQQEEKDNMVQIKYKQKKNKDKSVYLSKTTEENEDDKPMTKEQMAELYKDTS
jgi:hypothetical protein